MLSYMIFTTNIKFLNNIFYTKKSKTRGNSYKPIKSKQQNRLNIRANAFSQRVVNDWNSLPEDFVISKDLNNFKSTLNKH